MDWREFLADLQEALIESWEDFVAQNQGLAEVFLEALRRLQHTPQPPAAMLQPPDWWIRIVMEELEALQELVDLTHLSEVVLNCIFDGLWVRTSSAVTNVQNVGIEILPHRVSAFVVSTFYEQLTHCLAIQTR